LGLVAAGADVIDEREGRHVTLGDRELFFPAIGSSLAARRFLAKMPDGYLDVNELDDFGERLDLQRVCVRILEGYPLDMRSKLWCELHRGATRAILGRLAAWALATRIVRLLASGEVRPRPAEQLDLFAIAGIEPPEELAKMAAKLKEKAAKAAKQQQVDQEAAEAAKSQRVAEQEHRDQDRAAGKHPVFVSAPAELRHWRCRTLQLGDGARSAAGPGVGGGHLSASGTDKPESLHRPGRQG
jgi:hypothetical protein